MTLSLQIHYLEFPTLRFPHIYSYIYISIYNVPDRPVISSSGFLDHHLQPLAQAVKSYITDTKEF